MDLNKNVPELVLTTGKSEALTTSDQKEKLTNTDLDINNLTPAEQQAIRDFVKKIDIKDSTMIVQYGAPAQTKISAFADNMLAKIKTKDTGEVGSLLTNLVVEIKDFDKDVNDKGIMGFFNNQKNKMKKISTKYENVQANIDKITNNLEQNKMQLLKDVTMFDQLFEANLVHFKELGMYIIAGEEKLKDLNENVLPELKKQAIETNDAAISQQVNDLISLIGRFDKRVHDLKLSRAISLQMAPQIRLLQNNDNELIDKIQSSILNTIPLWKNQIVLALGLENSRRAMEVQKKVSDMTNELLKKNSEMLKTSTIAIAQESERGIVDLDTLKKTNEDLITTIDEVIRIHSEGREKRLLAEKELQSMEEQLKEKLRTAK
ncbi:MAG: toxic anion resistance protein [Oscillospiraceae bacterium]|nr:toxic anion resistance protein [Oscillospiraceae bacterium]